MLTSMLTSACQDREIELFWTHVSLNYVVEVVLSSHTFTAITTSRLVFHLSSVQCSNLWDWLEIMVRVQDTYKEPLVLVHSNDKKFVAENFGISDNH